MNILRRFLSLSAVATAGTALAQQPGAVLLPAQVVADPPASVVRGATPFEKAPAFAPVSWDSTPTSTPTATPVPKFDDSTPAAKPSQRSWVSSQMNGVKDFFVGKPGTTPASTTTVKPYAPFGPTAQPPVPMMGAVPAKTQVAPNSYPRPMAGAPAQPAPAPSGVYAGPPAYRWYGWGSTTPGANPHSPTGLYPKASATWYSQTGATPGAFPIPVTLTRAEPAGAEPPIYTGGPNTAVVESADFKVGLRSTIADSASTLPSPPTIPAPTGLVPLTPPVMPTLTPAVVPPSTEMPVGVPQPIAVSNANPIQVPKSAVEPVVATESMGWQPSSKPSATPVSTPPVMPKPDTELAPTGGPVPPTAPIPAPKLEEQAWGRPKNSNGDVIHASSTVVRGQQPHDPGATLDLSIRNACPKNIQRVEINRIGGNGLVIRFVVDHESVAQDAATVIAQLPELKAFDVRYEALLLAR